MSSVLQARTEENFSYGSRYDGRPRNDGWSRNVWHDDLDAGRIVAQRCPVGGNHLARHALAESEAHANDAIYLTATRCVPLLRARIQAAPTDARDISGR